MNKRQAFNPLSHGEIRLHSDGSILVYFSRLLPYPIDQVWRMISDPAALKHWFPGCKLEPQINGNFHIWLDSDSTGPADLNGKVEVFKPPHKLQLGSILYTLNITSDGCQLVFSDVLNFGESLTQQHHAILVLGGWHAFLDKLEYALAGNTPCIEVTEPDYSKIDIPGWRFLA